MIAVIHVTNAPFLSTGVAYFGAQAMMQLPPQMTVAANCAPNALGGVGDSTLVPFSYGFPKIDSSTAGITHGAPGEDRPIP